MRGVSVLAVVAAASLTAGCVGGTPTVTKTPGSGLSSVPGLPDAALEVMNQPQFASGRWVISVADLDTGEILVDLDGDKLAEPGSFVKTYSAGAAWVKWGPDHTITTPVKQSGTVAGGTLTGDLILVGQGDLTMGGRTKADGTVDFANLDHNDANPLPGATLTPEDPLAGLNKLAAQVKASGIDAVNGDVVVDDRLFTGTLAEKPVTPTIINQNLLDIMVTPGAAGEPATAALTPAVGPWKLVNEVKTVAAGEKAVLENPAISPDDPNTIVIAGTVAAGSNPALKVWELDDTATFARTALIEALQRAGVSVTANPTAVNPGASLPDTAAVTALPAAAELVSLPLAEEVKYVMKISYNRGAQALVCRIAADAGLTDCDDGMALIQKIWSDAGLDTLGASLIDGSGLEGNFITPQNAVDIQTLMAKRPDAGRWKETLPILGVDGSLADVQKGSEAAGKVFAKTGTLVGGDALNDRVRLTTKTLGGVMDTEKGRHLAFTIIVNQGFYPDNSGVFEANDDVGKVAALIQEAY
ncbi:D-alanyl-D-alanine carboxypeptidase/D-alanyl-D-alanine-endopeptidase [Subtercola boreus]|uniref:D-alanyl-D-alanine carboxypeptidase/D-alanyl-D-alanine-endopeptidase n=1 Tax=Subtercola boreus TaxID=120213 RepID=A0A3E0W2B9_9MICO|nr:D-alanyl-D-alanine carboxypeptidase/D-alanyl-D-alanine-endopeptidase [Subtercola boreus]RFA15708.1 D-alanyl-D-alanine carboxypeptidase/D-alanyl-D-alanine-endopeptidase [Subtercola boreus]